MLKKSLKGKAWIIAADMGYGHQRAAYPLKDIAYERIINANSDKSISPWEQRVWRRARGLYEWVSRTNAVPIFGKLLFNLYDQLQKIEPYYPLMNNEKPTLQVNYLDRMIRRGLGQGLYDYTSKVNIPVITTFYIPAISADYYGAKNVYCIITDTDLNRIWVPKELEKSRITYFAPTQHAYNRLISYGVSSDNIILTGFPLPKENIGGRQERIIKKVMAERIARLDPKKNFMKNYGEVVEKQLKKKVAARKGPVTIMYVVGGAGAQKEVGKALITSFKDDIRKGKIRLLLSAGTHLDINEYFIKEIKKSKLADYSGKGIDIIFELTKKEYFEKFNKKLNETDILWTKPSELSFYCALGLPVVVTAPLGNQEY